MATEVKTKNVPRDGYGRCRQCGGPFKFEGVITAHHTTGCPYYQKPRGTHSN